MNYTERKLCIKSSQINTINKNYLEVDCVFYNCLISLILQNQIVVPHGLKAQ